MMYTPSYHFLRQTTSTNDEARDPRYVHGDLIAAEHQTAGRGQRGHAWSSGEGDNLLVSQVWEPRFLPAREQFLLVETVALALTDLLGFYAIPAKIKWTNDIYVGDRKLVGILIENDLKGDHIARSVVGIGLNVNQTAFDPELLNPTSMKLLHGTAFDRQEVLFRLGDCLAARYDELERGFGERLQREYHERLYRLGECHPYRHPDGRTVDAILRGVRPSGELLLELPDGRVEGYLFQEIGFVIGGKG